MVLTTLVFILIGKLVIHTFAHLAKLLEDLVVSFINCLHLIKVILILLVRFGELLNDLWSPEGRISVRGWWLDHLSDHADMFHLLISSRNLGGLFTNDGVVLLVVNSIAALLEF